MKLYGTITSERASKGQGGNNFLSFEFTVGEEDEKQTILYGMIERQETEDANIYLLWNGDIQADKIIIPKKGKQQKGDVPCKKCGERRDVEALICNNCKP